MVEEATESAVADLLYDLGDKASFEEEEEEASFDSDSARASASNFLRLKWKICFKVTFDTIRRKKRDLSHGYYKKQKLKLENMTEA